MYLIECFNNEKTKDCTRLYNIESNYTLQFSTSLEDVAKIDIEDENIVELTNGIETYTIQFEDSLKNIWRIE